MVEIETTGESMQALWHDFNQAKKALNGHYLLKDYLVRIDRYRRLRECLSIVLGEYPENMTPQDEPHIESEGSIVSE